MPKYSSKEEHGIGVPEGFDLVEIWGVVGFEIDPEQFRQYSRGRFEPIRMSSKEFETEAKAQKYADSVHPAWQARPVKFLVYSKLATEADLLETEAELS